MATRRPSAAGRDNRRHQQLLVLRRPRHPAAAIHSVTHRTECLTEAGTAARPSPRVSAPRRGIETRSRTDVLAPTFPLQLSEPQCVRLVRPVDLHQRETRPVNRRPILACRHGTQSWPPLRATPEAAQTWSWTM